MKTLPAIIAASFLVASFGASAASIERTETDTLVTNVASSPAQAFKLGESILTQLKSNPMSGNYLTVHSGYADLSTLHVNEGAYVTVQERMSEDGKLGYVGLLNVDYSYTENDDQ